MNYEEIIAKHDPAQNHWELTQVLLLVKIINPKVILEIGTHRGGSYKVWRDIFKPKILVSIENSDEFEYPDLNVVRGKSQLQETKDKVVEKLQGEPVDFLYIDGGHYYADIIEDFKMYAGLVRKSGFIGFHDIKPVNIPGVDIHRFWNEIKNAYPNVEIFNPGGSGTGIGLIFKDEKHEI